MLPLTVHRNSVLRTWLRRSFMQLLAQRSICPAQRVRASKIYPPPKCSALLTYQRETLALQPKHPRYIGKPMTPSPQSHVSTEVRIPVRWQHETPEPRCEECSRRKGPRRFQGVCWKGGLGIWFGT